MGHVQINLFGSFHVERDGKSVDEQLARLRLSYQVQHRAKKGKTLRALCVRMKLPHTN